MRFTDALFDALTAELKAHLGEVERDAGRNLDVDGSNYTYDTRNNLVSDAERNGFEIEGYVGSDGKHAAYVNNGRRKDKPWPPKKPIEEWAKTKLGIAPGPELDRAVFLIRRKIGRKGIKGTRFLDRAFEARLDDLRPRLARAADRALDGVSIL